MARLDETETATSITREHWAVPFLELLGYRPIYQAKAEIVDNQTYAISHRTEEGENKPPLHIIGCRIDLDKRPPSGNPRLSAHGLMQEYLNHTEHLWGIVTNGYQWRLLRDCSLMTRLSYVEFDLEQILNSENYADFGLFYRLFHRSRLPEGMDDTDKCLLEFYHQEAIQQGGRVRDKLRDGVEKALQLFGTGFLQHPQNQSLRDVLATNQLSEKEFYRQLLLLIYRLLFLMVAESRQVLMVEEDAEKARIYMEYYSITRLRQLAERPSYRREGFQDLWQGLRVTFRLFNENWQGKMLRLSPLNGDLFGSKVLQTLDNYAIDNYDFLQAIAHLSLYEQKGQRRRVNYAALDVEELGSIYESLLDFTPRVLIRNGIHEFRLVAGSDRKTTGSYYTPPELVAQLIKSALEPVIEEKLKALNITVEQEKALLSLKICDPACGSGHFLLAAARRIGKELAKVRTGEAQPGAEPIKQAIRDVIQHCIYGVDLNPLAVDLCKVALWIEGFCKGLPLNFLDHRIKCGNSLVGVLDISCLDEGIPDAAYTAVTGDNKTLATTIKKRNKKERENQGQLSIFGDLSEERQYYGQGWQQLSDLQEISTDDVRRKQEQYQANRNHKGWWRDHSACNLWTAAFFMPLTEEGLQLLPTTEALKQLLRGNDSTQKIVEAANQLAEEKRFFHWCLEFPDVFDEGGFSCVLGNPPWERIKLQEKEFFASKNPDIANAANKAAREKLIKQLATSNPQLLQEFADAKHDADAQSKFIRESARFPLTAVGDINTYAVFAETTRKLISPTGRVGIIVPTGIATDDTCKKFFGDLIQNQNLASLYDFENREHLFTALHTKTKFCLLFLSKAAVKDISFSFISTNINDLKNPDKVFKLSSKDISSFNPNTQTCPLFRSRIDAELTKKIYQRVPVLENEKTEVNSWGISFMPMFHMSNDSHLFKNEAKNGLLPLYEAKMFHQFDHRWATYDGTEAKDVSLEDKSNSTFQITPRYWVSKTEVENRLASKWDKKWLLSFRSITDSRNERTAIFSIIPRVGVGHSAPLMIIDIKQISLVCCLLTNLSSLVFDFVVRQKLGGTNFSLFILKQLPVIPPDRYTQEDIEYISSRVLELFYTAYDMKLFALDLGHDGEPFIWDENRRAKLRAELDAKYAKLYGLTRDELRYILDPADVYGEDFPSETFRVLKNNEIRKYGEYRTQRLVLAAWDMMNN
ncbi:restriction endonuclease [Aphanothece hegewaldii CCALA 016]|uniref:site-specific DNA-methyltransferase (adenine-specific) n=1 Tax=Aphanothece hegewaldii CCALA 016 TaxID=2107694 RepID=A0A2T1LT10_9CHRO|nr:restriction endonuclease [Aphanothece hegewaldii CCALA 016]